MIRWLIILLVLLIVGCKGVYTPEDCAGEIDKNVELWGECYNIAETDTLILYDNQLTGEIPSEIGNLTNLTWLYLYYNQLTGEIPQEVCDLIESNNLFMNNILTGNNLINTCE